MANNNDKNEEKRYAKPGDDKIVSGKGFLISMPSFGKSKRNPAKALIDATSGTGNRSADSGKKQGGDMKVDNRKPASGNEGERTKKSRFGKGRRHENSDGAKTPDVKSTDVKNGENGNRRGAKDGASKAADNHGDKNKSQNADRQKPQNGNNVNDTQRSKQRPQKHGARSADAKSAADSKSAIESKSATNAKAAVEAKTTSETKTTSEAKTTSEMKSASNASDSARRDSGRKGRRNGRNGKDEVASNNNAGKNGAKGTAQGASQDATQGVSQNAAQNAAQNASPQNSVNKPSQKPRKQEAVSEQRERNQKRRDKKGRDGKPESAKVERTPQAPRKAVSAAAKNGGVGEVTSGIFTATPIRRDDSFFSRFDAAEDKIKGKKQKQVIEEEPQLVDRSRPLAEQIEEEIELRRAEQKKTEDKTEIVGVRFRDSGKIYYFDPQGLQIEADSRVIVETQRGIEYAFAAIGNTMVSTSKVIFPLRPVIRTATPADTERYKNNKKLEEDAAEIFKDRVAKLGLEMALVYVEYTFDNSKLLFYFTADGRVDFRELIKELASEFRTRIELRQIGVRDEAKLVGGLGICGRPVCCNTFLSDFSQVSIKMAKEQNLFLNSSKISGTCGRFMCCLKYEDESYRREYEITPRVGEEVFTPEGKGKVIESNALTGAVKVAMLDSDRTDGAPKSYDRSELTLVNPRPKPKQTEKPEKTSEDTSEGAVSKTSQRGDEDMDTVEKSVSTDKDNADAEVDAGVGNEAVDNVEVDNEDVDNEDVGNAVVDNEVVVNAEADDVIGKTASDTAVDRAEKTAVAEPKPDSASKLPSKTSKSTAVERKPEQAFADGIIKIDEAEAEIEAKILAENYEIKRSELGDDFKVSSESTSKGSSFADGIITIEE